jgi:hypothetical protein
MALELVYIPLPDSVVNQIQAAWKSHIKDPSGRPVW